jgi:hypothetical protein
MGEQVSGLRMVVLVVRWVDPLVVLAAADYDCVLSIYKECSFL